MSIVLKVKTEVMKTKAAEVEADVKAVEDEFNSIQDIVSRTTGYWLGVAGDKARAEFNAQKDDIQLIIKRFREHPTDLMVMAGVYEGAERDITSANKALEADVII